MGEVILTLLTSLVHPGMSQIIGISGPAADSFRLEGVSVNTSILISSPVAKTKVTDTTVGGSSLKPSKTPHIHKEYSTKSNSPLFADGGKKDLASAELYLNSVASIHTYEVEKHQTKKGTLNV